MKEVLKRKLRTLLNFLFLKIGYSRIDFGRNNSNVNPYTKDYLLNNLIGILHKCHFTPKLIIDVGANHGSWTRVWKNAFPEASFILIEPQHWLKASFEDLLDSKTLYLPIGAGAENTIADFTINKDRDDSSTFIMNKNEAIAVGYKQIKVPIKSLNTIVKESGLSFPDIVKIDAEGLDIEVLKGATDLFGKTEIFLVEASINAKFENNTLLEVVFFMNQFGYKVFDITDINRPFENNILWLVELVFIKKDGFLFKNYISL